MLSNSYSFIPVFLLKTNTFSLLGIPFLMYKSFALLPSRNSSKDIVNQLRINYRTETYQKFLKDTFKNYDENDREFFKIKEEIFKTIRIGA